MGRCGARGKRCSEHYRRSSCLIRVASTGASISRYRALPDPGASATACSEAMDLSVHPDDNNLCNPPIAAIPKISSALYYDGGSNNAIDYHRSKVLGRAFQINASKFWDFQFVGLISVASQQVSDFLGKHEELLRSPNASGVSASKRLNNTDWIAFTKTYSGRNCYRGERIHGDYMTKMLYLAYTTAAALIEIHDWIIAKTDALGTAISEIMNSGSHQEQWRAIKYQSLNYKYLPIATASLQCVDAARALMKALENGDLAAAANVAKNGSLVLDIGM